MAATTKLVHAFRLSSKIPSSLLSHQVHRQSLSARCRCSLSTKPTDQSDSENETKKEPSHSNEDKLSAEVKKLEESIKDVKDKYMRSLAETENLRKRMVKQVDDARTYGIQGFCKDLLEVSDILGTAISSVPKEELKDSNPHLQSLYQGLNMTESQLVKVFKKHGLESIAPSEGTKFDPHIHEALFQVPIQVQETQEADTVAVVQKNGFKLHDRTLRPALVGVFKGS